MSLMDILNVHLNTSFGESFTPYNTNKFKWSQDLVVGERWGVNELVTVVDHLAHKSKHII